MALYNRWAKRQMAYRADCGHDLTIGVPATCRACYLADPGRPAMDRLGQHEQEVRCLLGTMTLTAAADFLVVDRHTLAAFCRARGIPYGRPGQRRQAARVA